MFRNALITLTAAVLVAQTPAPEVNKVKAPAPALEVKKAAEAKKPAALAPKAEAKVEAKKEDMVLATVAGRLVRESDFELFLSLALNPQQRAQVGMVQGAKDPYRKQFLDTKVMQAAARKQGLDKSPEFRKKMELMEMQVLVQELLQRDGEALKAKLAVDEAEVKAYFEKNADQFKTPGTFNARHILVAIKAPGAPEGTKGFTEAEAKVRVGLAAKALAEGKTWDVVAKEFSDDPGSKDKGGLYENIANGSFVPEFEAAVLKQELGKVGEPVKTNFGFHLIQAEKRNAAEAPVFEKVKDQVQKKAQALKQESVFQAYVDGLKKDVGYSVGEGAPEVKQPVTTPKAKSSKKSVAK